MHQEKKDIILVVEDDVNSRLLLKTYLTSDGYQVILAGTGEQAACRGWF